LNWPVAERKQDPTNFRVKEGGSQRNNQVKIDLYSSVQNIKANINTTAAKNGQLIRRSFMIWQINDGSVPYLKILEWDAPAGWGKGYREICCKKLQDPRAKQKIAQLMSDSIVELSFKRSGAMKLLSEFVRPTSYPLNG
jgi:hypothetical protein